MARSPAGAPTAEIAAFAAGLDGTAVPADVRGLARDCLVDAVACAVFGARFPWSRIVAETAPRPKGKACPPGFGFATDAATAALVAGAAAHAFELDSLRKPGAGVHPGATVALPALMLAEETGASGRALIDAIVVGIEAMFRIGTATLHSAEVRGFHAPGITGPLGAAVAAGRILGLDDARMAQAIGLAASMTGGILAFAATGTGGMVKRLHLGRAAEAGILAARLAERGYEAPREVLTGRHGILETFCAASDPALLTRDLGQDWETRTTCFKRYACHVTAQAPVETLRGWIAAGLDPAEIRVIRVAAPRKIATVHNIPRPADLALAQYSLPFMLAFAAFHDLDDPSVLTDASIQDPRVRALAERIEVTEDAARSGWAVGLEVEADRLLTAEADSFEGMPGRHHDTVALEARFLRLAGQGAAPAWRALRDIDGPAPVRLPRIDASA